MVLSFSRHYDHNISSGHLLSLLPPKKKLLRGADGLLDLGAVGGPGYDGRADRAEHGADDTNGVGV